MHAICNDQPFWRRYFDKHDFSLPTQPLTLKEWVRLYQSHVTARQFVRVLELIVTTLKDPIQFYISNINLKDTIWLPPNTTVALNQQQTMIH